MASSAFREQPVTEVFTIGHSTLDYESFLALLKQANVTAIADVRSSPQSQHFPHFDQEILKAELSKDGIAYVFLGAELGGRPKNPEFYCDEVADYDKMATGEAFKKGIKRVIAGAENYRIALMCSESSPFDCHRCLLVGRALSDGGVTVRHILTNGRQLSQRDIENQLVYEYGKGAADMFAEGFVQLANAYRERALQVSYRKPPSKPRPDNPVAAE